MFIKETPLSPPLPRVLFSGAAGVSSGDRRSVMRYYSWNVLITAGKSSSSLSWIYQQLLMTKLLVKWLFLLLVWMYALLVANHFREMYRLFDPTWPKSLVFFYMAAFPRLCLSLVSRWGWSSAIFANCVCFMLVRPRFCRVVIDFFSTPLAYSFGSSDPSFWVVSLPSSWKLPTRLSSYRSENLTGGSSLSKPS